MTPVTKTQALAALIAKREEEVIRVYGSAQNGKNSNVYEKFAKAEAEIRAIETLTLIVSAEIPDQELEKIYNQIKPLIKTPFLLDLRIEPGVLGGVAFVWQGKIKDYTIKAKLEEKRELIRATIRKVLVAGHLCV